MARMALILNPRKQSDLCKIPISPITISARMLTDQALRDAQENNGGSGEKGDGGS